MDALRAIDSGETACSKSEDKTKNQFMVQQQKKSRSGCINNKKGLPTPWVCVLCSSTFVWTFVPCCSRSPRYFTIRTVKTRRQQKTPDRRTKNNTSMRARQQP
eukprot:GEMP01079492.1.p2 GENE.GEMP01079492.1~~GEMP01079492.1.p2  ORF type:complete len:103 (+),score=6.62 GEMP01079492.1:268-576(+)